MLADGWDATADGALLIEPAADRWRSLIDQSWKVHRADAAAIRLRSQLGLPTDRPLIMSGHQAILWHPGILAKWLAMDAAASEMGDAQRAGRAWVVVDQDTAEASPIWFPRKGDDGVWRRDAWRWSNELEGDIPACALDAQNPEPLPSLAGVPAEVSAGLGRTQEALRAAARNDSMASQVMSATNELLKGLAQSAAIVRATSLANTDRLAELVSSMQSQTERCVTAYNRAVRAHPDAGLRPMLADEVQDRWELPLWRIRRGRARARIHAEDLPSIPPGELAPRAILMTALLRSGACDLFIHGLGGGLYDRATDMWFAEWMPDVRLAPTAVVSATLHLPLADGPAPSRPDVRRAIWRAHHAAHNPAALGDVQSQQHKSALVRELRSLPHGSSDRRRVFDRIQEYLAQWRRAHDRPLADAVSEARFARSQWEASAITHARDWSFPLHGRATLESLRDRMVEQFKQ